MCMLLRVDGNLGVGHAVFRGNGVTGAQHLREQAGGLNLRRSDLIGRAGLRLKRHAQKTGVQIDVYSAPRRPKLKCRT